MCHLCIIIQEKKAYHYFFMHKTSHVHLSFPFEHILTFNVTSFPLLVSYWLWHENATIFSVKGMRRTAKQCSRSESLPLLFSLLLVDQEIAALQLHIVDSNNNVCTVAISVPVETVSHVRSTRHSAWTEFRKDVLKPKRKQIYVPQKSVHLSH